MKILWLSRHKPQDAQVAALMAKFGDDIEIIERSMTLDNDPRAGADQIETLLDTIGADDMVGVLPIAHMAELTRRGIQPIRAVMAREPTGAVLPNGEIEYRFTFECFVRVLKVIVQTEPL